MIRLALAVCAVLVSSVLAAAEEAHHFEAFKPESTASNGTVSVDGHAISYQAIAGTLVIHPKDWDDVPRDPNTEKPGPAASEDGGDSKNPTAVASMFYVAYFKKGKPPAEAAGRSPSSSTAARAPRPCGCTWARSARSAS